MHFCRFPINLAFMLFSTIGFCYHIFSNSTPLTRGVFSMLTQANFFFYEFSVMCFFWDWKASESIVAWYFFFFFYDNLIIHCTHILITYTCLIHLRITIVLVALSWYDSWFMKMKIIYIGICWYMFNTNCFEIHLAPGSNCSLFVCLFVCLFWGEMI